MAARGLQVFPARFARLYPLYLFVLLTGSGTLGVLLFHSPFFFSYLTMTQSWFSHQTLMAELTWSISTEWFFYLAFALAEPALSRLTSTRACLTGLLLAVALAMLSQWLVFTHEQRLVHSLSKIWLAVPSDWLPGFPILSVFAPLRFHDGCIRRQAVSEHPTLG